jgi:hypothetical protein
MAAIMDMDQDVKPGTASILNWYDSTRPMFIDLVGDYAGKELFLIEGDSLLRETFEDERIDFRGKSPLSIFPVAFWGDVIDMSLFTLSTACSALSSPLCAIWDDGLIGRITSQQDPRTSIQVHYQP